MRPNTRLAVSLTCVTFIAALTGSATTGAQGTLVGGATDPAWRVGLRVGALSEIPMKSLAGHDNTRTGGMLSWGGGSWSPRAFYVVGDGGHGDGDSNAAFKLNLGVSTPAWSTLYAGSDRKHVTADSPYYKDGRPTSRHVYWSAHYDPVKNGVFLVTMRAAYGNGQTWTQQVDRFDLAKNDYDAAGTWKTGPAFPNGPAAITQAQDPVTGKVYFPYLSSIGKDWGVIWFDPSTNSWSSTFGITIYDSFVGTVASCIDTTRNVIVVLDSGPTLRRIKLSGGGRTTLTFSGATDGEGIAAAGIVYDPTDDNYYFLTSAGKLYKVVASTGVLTKVATLSEAVDNHVAGKIAYLSGLRGIAMLPSRGATKLAFFPVRP